MIIRTKADIDKIIQRLNDLDLTKVWKCVIKQRRGQRSIPQNSLYWLWIARIKDVTGNDKDCLHEYFKEKYLGLEAETVFGQEVSKPRSTTGLDTKQFSEYMNEIQAFVATELGEQLPNPEDMEYEAFIEYYQDKI